MQITWDPPKRQANIERRGLDFAIITSAFFEAAVVGPAKHDRYKALGIVDGMAVAVIFKPLGSQGIAVISMRPASQKERRIL